MPKKYSIKSGLSFIANGAKKSIIYTLDDYDTRVLQGDLESQGEYLGEYLFNVALDLATGGIQSKLDDVAEYSDDAARLTTKQIALDETKVAFSKADGDNWQDIIKGTGELADTGVYFNIGNLDGIDNINDILPRVGLTKDEFNSLRLKDISTLSDQEKKLMRVIRENISNPTSDTMLQKVIPYQDIEKYMNGSYNKVGGFVTKAEDVSHLKTYDEIYDAFRLDYPDTAFNPNADTALGVIRYKTEQASKIEIAFGKEMGGTAIGDPPFTGNGFTKATNGEIIPEYRFTDYVKIDDGAQLVLINKDGTEILLAVYDSTKGKFVPVS